jgi:exosortase
VAVGIEAWRDIWHIAMRDEEASHVFLVPIVVPYLVWVRRLRLRHVRPVGLWMGPVLVATGWYLFDMGDAKLWQSVWHFGAILITVGCLLSVVGTQVLRALVPAFLVLVFLIPVPGRLRQRIALPMQNATARVTEAVFELADVPITRNGNMLRINGVDVAIAEACNGLRMVFALVLVCYAFAFGNPLRPYAQLLILAMSPLAAIVCNVLRLIPTVYIYGYYSAGVGDTFHAASGWVMLFVAFFMLMGILRLLRWALIPVYRFTLAYD